MVHCQSFYRFFSSFIFFSILAWERIRHYVNKLDAFISLFFRKLREGRSRDFTLRVHAGTKSKCDKYKHMQKETFPFSGERLHDNSVISNILLLKVHFQLFSMFESFHWWFKIIKVRLKQKIIPNFTHTVISGPYLLLGFKKWPLSFN